LLAMKYFVYIIKSELDSSYYIGHAQDPQLRVFRHNDGWTRSTKSKRPWRLMYNEDYPSKGDAIRREHEIKRMKSRKYIENLIRHVPLRPGDGAMRESERDPRFGSHSPLKNGARGPDRDRRSSRSP